VFLPSLYLFDYSKTPFSSDFADSLYYNQTMGSIGTTWRELDVAVIGGGIGMQNPASTSKHPRSSAKWVLFQEV
jgi:hypothetical protein